MKFIWKYLFPALFGLLTYTSIRLVNDTTIGQNFFHRPWQQNAIEVVLVIIMGYLFTFMLTYFLHRFNRRKHAFGIRALAFEFGQVFFSSFVAVTCILYLTHYLVGIQVKLNDFVIAQIIVLLYVLLYYAIVRGNNMLKAYVTQQTHLQKVKNENLQTELKFLKLQFHPHFLFNALNTIYFQMDEDVQTAKKTVERFSELLRYQLYDQQQKVSMKQEREYLQNYIDLQKVRMSQKLQLYVCFDPELDGQLIYPLLLLPLVENAFKYVGGKYAINIRAEKKGEGIYFTVYNDLPSNVFLDKKEGGIGLENVKRRLELLYPDLHRLSTRQVNNHYVAELFLQTEGA